MNEETQSILNLGVLVTLMIPAGSQPVAQDHPNRRVGDPGLWNINKVKGTGKRKKEKS